MKSEKVTIERIHRSDKDKTGNLFTTKDGRNYTRIGIKTQEHGEKWLSGFGNSENSNWNVGDKVEIIVEENGQYLNFRNMPRNVSYKDFQDLKARVEKLEILIKITVPNSQPFEEGIPEPTSTCQDEEILF